MKNIAIAVFGLMAVSCIQSNTHSNHDQTEATSIKEPNSPGNPIIPIDPPVVTPIEPPEVKPTVKEVSDRSLISKDSTYEVYGTIDGCGHSKEGWIISSDSTKTKFPVIKQGTGVCYLDVHSIKVSNKLNEYQYHTFATVNGLVAHKNIKRFATIDTQLGTITLDSQNRFYLSDSKTIEGVYGLDMLCSGFLVIKMTQNNDRFLLETHVYEDSEPTVIGVYKHKDRIVGEYQYTTKTGLFTEQSPVVFSSYPKPKKSFKISISSNVRISDSTRMPYSPVTDGYVYSSDSMTGEVKFTLKSLSEVSDSTQTAYCWSSAGLWGTFSGVSTKVGYENVIDIQSFSFPWRDYYSMNGRLGVIRIIPYGSDSIKSLMIDVNCRFSDGSVISEAVESHS